MIRPQTPASTFATDPASQARRGRKGKGATRAKLAMSLIEDLSTLWEEQGESVLARAAFADPVAVLNAMVRLMPQKIEVSHPTEGMSDEDLAAAIAHYERMAALKAGAIEGELVQPALTHEKRLDGMVPQSRGGGPVASEPPVAEKLPHTIVATGAENAESTNTLEPDSTNATELPYPVFRKPPAEMAHTVEARNRAKLDDIDPESLF